jgi:2-dehydro-3-deoxygluconokinase
VAAPLEIATIGESMALLAPSPLGPVEDAAAFTMDVGGAESNVAMYLSDLGHRVAWISRLGDDPMGRRILGRIDGAGVDTTLVRLDASARTGVYFKDPTDSGTTVYYYRDGSAASRMGPEVLTASALRDVPLVHLTGITPALARSCHELVRAAVIDRRLPRALVSFDVNYRPGLWPVARAAPVLAELADASDLVLVGLDEARHLWGCERPEDVRRRLPGPGTIVVKDGPVAAHHLDREAAVSVAAPVVEVVEEVGAGDAFAAGYLSAMLRGGSPRHRLRLGHLVAAHALRIVGDHAPLPDRTWFDAELQADEGTWTTLRLGAPADPDPSGGREEVEGV